MAIKWLFPLLIFFCSCKEKTPTPDVPIVPIQPLKMLWKTRITDSFLSSSILPIIYKDKVIYTTDDMVKPTKMFFLDAATGKVQNTWINDKPHSGFRSQIPRTPYNDMLAIAAGGRTFGINLATQTKVWNYLGEGSGGRFEKRFGGDLFVDFSLTNNYILNKFIVKFNIESGARDTILKINSPNKDIIPHGLSYEVSQNAQGDTLLLVLISWNNDIEKNGMQEIFSYNLRTKEKSSSWNLPYFGAQRKLVLDGDLLYLHVLDNNNIQDYMLCVNLKTKQEVWRTNIPRESITSEMLLKDGKLFANIEDERLRAFDAKTGKILWAVPTGNFASHVLCYKGVIYCVGRGQLVAVDPNTGIEKFRMNGPDFAKNGNLFFQSMATLDEEKGRLYMYDWANAICYDLN